MKRVFLTDPRLAAIAAGSLDDAVVALPDTGVVAIPVDQPSPISLRRDGNVALFKIEDAPAEVAVRIDNGEAVFFPQRSSAHRQLLAKLGIDE